MKSNERAAIWRAAIRCQACHSTDFLVEISVLRDEARLTCSACGLQREVDFVRWELPRTPPATAPALELGEMGTL